MSRRRLFQTGISIVSSTLVSSMAMTDRKKTKNTPRASALQENPGKGYIDAHVHVWTSDTKRYPLAPGFRREQMRPPDFPPEELLAHARPCGVTRIVLIQMSYYGYDNSYMLDTMRQFPGVFSGVAVIDEAARPREVMRRLRKQGVRGFRISPMGKAVDRWLDSPGMEAMWRCGGDENLSMCGLIDPDAIPGIARMCERFPSTPVVIDHIARIMVGNPNREEELRQLCHLARHKNVSVKVSAFYALSKDQPSYLDLGPAIRRLLDAYGPERLMWATDCPFQVQGGHTYSGSLALIRDRLDFLSAGDREWLLEKTAQRVFFS